MREWFRWQLPDPLVFAMLTLSFGLISSGSMIGIPNGAAIGVGVAVAAVLSSLVRRRAWWMLWGAFLVFDGVLSEPRSWASMPQSAQWATVTLDIVWAVAVVLFLLQAMGVLRLRAASEETPSPSS